MKGIEKFKERLPDYQGKRINKFIIIVIVAFISSIMFQLIMDSLPRIFRESNTLTILEPLTPILGSLIVLTIGFSLVYSFWRMRNKYLEKNRTLAYQKAFKFVVTGIPMVISIVIHSFFPTDLIIPYQDNQSISWFLAIPISDIFFSFSAIMLSIRLALFLIFFGLGLIVVRKALKIFGIDYMGLIYVYYPEDSTLQNHEIYSILRHPTYHSLMLFNIGSLLFRFSVYSIIYFIIFIIGINIHIKFVEERELIQRFGESYIKYRQSVPALFVRVKDLRKYFSIIF
ncbi:MAG: methyltransferase family protein [Candidatus Heimdallarchaeota archaeon]